jgi:GMP synthase-like glutamine amidotransferase
MIPINTNYKPLRIHYFQHVFFEGPGNIETWCIENGHLLSATKFFEDAVLPELSDIDWLIIMGGPMGVYDEEKFNWLAAEKQFIKKAIHAGKTIIGVCLGAQLLAETLGAKVYQNDYKEIGWLPVEVTPEGKNIHLFSNFENHAMVFHWHGDTFDLPQNAIHLAQSEACKNQAFLYKKKILGLQFHLEMNEQSLKEMLENGQSELISAKYIQSRNEILKHRKLIETNKKMLFTILDNLAEAGAEPLSQ